MYHKKKKKTKKLLPEKANRINAAIRDKEVKRGKLV